MTTSPFQFSSLSSDHTAVHTTKTVRVVHYVLEGVIKFISDFPLYEVLIVLDSNTTYINGTVCIVRSVHTLD